MKKISKHFMATIVEVLAFFAIFSFSNLHQEDPIRFLGDETDYAMTLDASQAQISLNNDPSSGSFIGPKNITFDYTNAMGSTGNILKLNSTDGGLLRNTDQITTIKSYRVVFSGDCRISFGWDYGTLALSYAQGENLQSGITYSVSGDYYYFQLSANSGEVTITSVTITYSCVPTPPSPQYTLSPDGLSYIVSGYSKNPSNLIIPSTYNGLPVTRIAAYTFQFVYGLTEVFIPDSITVIENYAFYGCPDLSSVRLPQNLLSLPAHIFDSCYSLQSILLPETLTSIGDYAFASSGLTAITIPSSVTHFGQGCFQNTGYLQSFVFDTPVQVNDIANNQFEASGLYSITLPEGITTIGDYAFSMSELEDITLPSTLTTIGNYAFSYTTSFTSIYGTLSNVDWIGEYAFESAYWQVQQLYSHPLVVFDHRIVVEGRSVTGALSLNSSIEHIAASAFYGNNNITSITLPSSLETIGDTAFKNAINLSTVNLDLATNLQMIGLEAFSGCTSLSNMNIPSSVVDIKDDAFYNTPWLGARIGSGILFIINQRIVVNAQVSGAITLPSTITRIHKRAFTSSGIESISLPEGLLYVGDQAFSQCDFLSSITIPNSVIYLGVHALSFSGLQSIVIGSGVTTIESYLSYGNYNLTSVTLTNNILEIKDYAFQNCYSLPSMTLPENLVSVGLSAFSGCTSLTTISIPGSVTHISQSAFSYTGLESVTINEGTQSIGDYAFEENALLTSVILPNSLFEIGNRAFAGCEDLTSLIVPLHVTWIGSEAFYNCTTLTIYARMSSLPSTWDPNWNDSACPVVWGYSS